MIKLSWDQWIYFVICINNLVISVQQICDTCNNYSDSLCIDNNTCQNQYHIPYQPKTPISALGLKAKRRCWSRMNMGCDADFDMYCCFHYIFDG